MRSNLWTIESWGAGYPPANANEIIDAVNEHLSAIEDEDEQEAASNFLWETLSDTGAVLGITALTTVCTPKNGIPEA